MTESEPRFTDYGDDGDEAGARRGRRSFRFVVTSVLLLTFSAWFAETRLRHSLQEQHFLSAITLPRESARVFLLAAIKLDDAASDTPTPKYTQALAVRQDDDIALETYARAFQLDPKNSMFAVRYGCRLYRLNRAEQAAEMFRTARALPPASALPRYLEAAAMAKAARGETALSEAMVVVSRANNTLDPLLYPKPLWYSAYPQSGVQYAQISREIYAEACAPLHALTQQVVLSAQQPDALAPGQDAATWLRQIETMGRRLVNDSEPKGTLQAIAGVSIQMDALRTLLHVLRQGGDGESAEVKTIEARLATLQDAWEILNEFEASREARLASIRREHQLPLFLLLEAAGALIGVYILARIVHGVLRYRKSAWTIPHSTFGKSMIAAAAVAVFAMLAFMTLMQRFPGGEEWYLGVLTTTWWTVLAILVGFGLVYPALRVPSPEQISGKSGRLEDMPDVIRFARAAHHRVYVALVVRYFGILAGVFLCTACVWILLYRVSHGLYPWQVNLLASGLIPNELDTVRQAVQLLGTR